MLTPLRLPLLREQTIEAFVKERMQHGRRGEIVQFENKALDKITQENPLFCELIQKTAALYQPRYQEEVRGDLIAAYTILSKEGPLPQLHQQVYNRHWNNFTIRDPILAKMAKQYRSMEEARNPFLMTAAFGLTFATVNSDNPFYAKFVHDTQSALPQIYRFHVATDLTTAYMLLVDSLTPENLPRPAPFSQDPRNN